MRWCMDYLPPCMWSEQSPKKRHIFPQLSWTFREEFQTKIGLQLASLYERRNYTLWRGRGKFKKAVEKHDRTSFNINSPPRTEPIRAELWRRIERAELWAEGWRRREKERVKKKNKDHSSNMLCSMSSTFYRVMEQN